MKRIFPILILVALFSALAYTGSLWSSAVVAESKVTVVSEPFFVWTPYQGELESRRVNMVMSRFRGAATIVWLVTEGEKVAKGDVVVRFDDSELEQDKVRLERDLALSLSEMESLENAELPIKRREIAVKLLDVRADLEAESRYLDSLTELASEKLVSAPEVNQQRMKVEKIRSEVESLEQKVKLTKEYLHPAELKQARAKVASARQALSLALEQIENSVIRAPADGVVVYRAIGVGEEFRHVRVGDLVYQNQPFMVIPDMTDLVVRFGVPEGELARIREGLRVSVRPLAFPALSIEGEVETVSSMAQAAPGKPDWQKYFSVLVGLKDRHAGLRPGMTVTAQVLSYQRPDALLVPRNAVKWERKEPFCEIMGDGIRKRVFLKLGWADETRFEVLEGLKAGDEVVVN